MAIRAVLVDDETPARDRLRRLLEAIEDVEIVAEARDGNEAVERIAASRPDLVLLDIEMPGMTGMQVAASLEPPRPQVVFCTAYDRYAIEAFEHHASDYLLKPVNRARLEKAVGRVRASLRERERVRRDLEAASHTQARLLPQSLPRISTLDYAGSCRPSGGVGGDYYDFLDLGRGRLGLALADVSGKGMFAGLLMAGLQARIQSLAPSHADRLDELVRQVNLQLCASTETNRYATLFCGAYDERERTLAYVNAGHLPALVLASADGYRGARLLAADGTVVGLLPEATYRASRWRFEPGDLFCIYTDGITEALSPDGEEFGAARLESTLRAHASRPAAELLSCVVAELDRHRGGSAQTDDLTLIVGKVR
jgi:sigma-B regulation protein RsbU (phosphoserine phosphatase)